MNSKGMITQKMKNRIYAYLLIMSALLIAGSLISYFSGNITLTSILLIPGFVALATGVRGYPKVKGLSYTLWIFTAVVV